MIGSLAIFLCLTPREDEAIWNAIYAVVDAGRDAEAAALAAGPSQDELGLAVALTFMGIASVVFLVKRALAVRRTFATSRRKIDADRALLVAAARRQVTRALVATSMCMGVLGVIAAAPLANDMRAVIAVTPALLMLVGFTTFWRLHRVLDAADDSDVRVQSHGDFLFAARGKRLVGWVAVPPRVAARAIALPVAQLRR